MKRWSKDEEKYLQENYGKIPVSKICKYLGRTKSSVTGKALYLELTRGKMMNWNIKKNRVNLSKNLKLKKEPNKVVENIVLRKKYYIDWDFIEKNHINTKFSEFCEIFNSPAKHLYTLAHRKGYVKDGYYLKKRSSPIRKLTKHTIDWDFIEKNHTNTTFSKFCEMFNSPAKHLYTYANKKGYIKRGDYLIQK